MKRLARADPARVVAAAFCFIGASVALIALARSAGVSRFAAPQFGQGKFRGLRFDAARSADQLLGSS